MLCKDTAGNVKEERTKEDEIDGRPPGTPIRNLVNILN